MPLSFLSPHKQEVRSERTNTRPPPTAPQPRKNLDRCTIAASPAAPRSDHNRSANFGDKRGFASHFAPVCSSGSGLLALPRESGLTLRTLLPREARGKQRNSIADLRCEIALGNSGP